jgi:hypothetical protein
LKYIKKIIYLLFCMGVTLGEKHKLMVFENRMLREVFGLMGEEVAGG